ncbi:ABC transporter permease [Corynebacterium uberis]|uniref:ABC transporter permease n=1 Tax=Corynebacterium TaxID=1716 RepID=UPI001D0AE59D|nr:ABC transporter permease [Corynebacterium uberis]MCZ9309914.1 ABC transporter permease [Corynebacterium sp. c6VSa_13]UDL73166.1 ABC transporter permease [Corynebacterium uberis]UDL75957.1 ABC transporter permease [Corynebacterium uberis]UDL78169.1 ABC transporter permease [Corynebacterium uberis]UDL80452.1 ABC transporter permease [Corynebacterium uberis]
MSPWSAVAAAWRRDVLRTIRNKAVMVSAVAIPSLFVAIFYATFAKAAREIGVDYAAFLLPAGVVQAIVFTASGSSLAITHDAENGLHDRIRTTGAPAWTIVCGRLLADLTRAAWSCAIVVVVALLLGAHFDGGPGRILLTAALFAALTIIFSACADGACLLSPKPVSTSLLFQNLVLVLILFSTAFVPADALPSGIGPVIRHVPLSPILDTARNLLSGAATGTRGIEALCWLIAMTIIGVWGFTVALQGRKHA